MRRGICFSLVLLIILTVSVLAEPLPVSAATENQRLSRPTKTYYLTLPPTVSERTIKLDPPGSQLIVTMTPGDLAIRCGDHFSIYTCTSGKPLKIMSSPETPIHEFWAQNPHDQIIILTIAVYEDDKYLHPAKVEQETTTHLETQPH